MCKHPLRFVAFLAFVVASATAQQDTFNVQTQPQPVNPSDAFSSDDCRTNPTQALQEWQAYYQLMRGVIDRRDQEESQGYQSQISSEQNLYIRASIKAHYDYEVNVVDAIWRLNTDSADKCVRNYILSGCKGTLNCPVKPTPPFKEPTFPPSSQPSPGVAKTTCGKFTAIVQSCPRGGPGSQGPLPGTGGIVGPACIMCFWRDANGYPAVHPQIIPAPGFIKSEYDPPGAAVKECGDRLKPGWVAESGLLCPTSRGTNVQAGIVSPPPRIITVPEGKIPEIISASQGTCRRYGPNEVICQTPGTTTNDDGGRASPEIPRIDYSCGKTQDDEKARNKRQLAGYDAFIAKYGNNAEVESRITKENDHHRACLDQLRLITGAISTSRPLEGGVSTQNPRDTGHEHGKFLYDGQTINTDISVYIGSISDDGRVVEGPVLPAQKYVAVRGFLKRNPDRLLVTQLKDNSGWQPIDFAKARTAGISLESVQTKNGDVVCIPVMLK